MKFKYNAIFIQHVLNTYCVPDIVVGVWDTSGNGMMPLGFVMLIV